MQVVYIVCICFALPQLYMFIILINENVIKKAYKGMQCNTIVNSWKSVCKFVLQLHHHENFEHACEYLALFMIYVHYMYLHRIGRTRVPRQCGNKAIYHVSNHNHCLDMFDCNHQTTV